ncbi:hypothetical protein VaNZ11_000751, partial [Volvox africanus]
MFYQHCTEGCQWQFGLVWGHCVSTDLVTWETLPYAIVPTPGGLDADGCFSGCATLDEYGVPTILYTGVRLRSKDSCGPLPPPECDLQLPFIETQCAARPVDPDDPKLTYWTKVEYPVLSLPPPFNGLERLSGWRDPAIIGRPGQDGSECWTMIIGSGIKDNGGSVLVYTSKALLDGWQLHGELCHGRENGATTGFMWECPILFQLQPLPRSSTLFGSAGQGALAAAAPDQAGNHDSTPSKPLYFFSISPDACTNPSYYWVGPYDPASKRFDLASAQGPIRLDLGNVLYAPNILDDTVKGRTLLWGWGQEQRNKVDVYDYAGCLTLPRVLWLECLGDALPSAAGTLGAAPGLWALHQQPLPELVELRHPQYSWCLRDALPPGVSDLIVDGGAKMPVPDVSGPFLDMELLFQPAADNNDNEPRCSASGLLLQSWSSGPEGSAALIYYWDTGVLE